MTDAHTDTSRLDWNKNDGLLPAIVQHARSGEVLMLGYMNVAALEQTRRTGLVTFFSRSRQRLWTKGETSGHHLALESVRVDCDGDALLVLAEPTGPTCHEGTPSCFGEHADVRPRLGFLAELEALVADRYRQRPAGSYTTELFATGIRRIAQKLGEEGVETALAAVAQTDQELLGEAADLIFHLTVLLRARDLSLADAVAELARRHDEATPTR